MKKNWMFVVGCSLLFFLSCNVSEPYKNTKLPPQERAEDLLGRLTLEEKISLMQNASPAIPRLGIKKYDWWNEALHGVGRAGLATVYPQSIGMAASFNDSLLHEVFTSVSDEARAKTNEFSKAGGLERYQGLTMWTPNVNIFRDPRWGRGQETYGEDPYLASRMGIAVVRGLQGPEDAQYDKLHACAKHYAVHSGPEWNRHSFDAKDISPRDLWETYLPAFKDLVQKAKVKEVMCAYNRFEGEPCCDNTQLLSKILRETWGFDGIVVSDCGAISDFYREKAHKTHPDKAHSSASAVISGTDLECGGEYKSLSEAVEKGLITEEQINTSLRRLLTARFELGEMDEKDPWNIPYSVVNSKEHQEQALKMAQETMVLLQNKNGILPLNKKMKIAIMGPNANDSVMQWGNYNGFPERTITLLAAIQKELPEAQIIYEESCGHTDNKMIKSLFHECTYNGKSGFGATYWNNRKWEGDTVTIDHLTTPFRYTTMGATAFAPGVNIKDFSAIYKTTFKPSQSGAVDFQFQTDGSTRLYIDGQEVAKDSDIRYPTNVYTLNAKANQEYQIEIKFAQTYGDAVLNFDMGIETVTDLQASVNRVKDADVVIFAGGISPSLEGEEMKVIIPGFRGGDRTDIELPAIQRELLKKLKAAGKKVILVNYSGSAMGLEPETQSCDAILQAWYPGQAGGTAVANVLFGDYNPAGRLPVTFYKNIDQLSHFEDYSMKGRTYRYMEQEPLFAFGHGLSYTTFAYGDASVYKKDIKKGDSVKLLIPVSNTGKADGEEVVQVYLRRADDKEGPLRALRAFKRVMIKSGQTSNIEVLLSPDEFEWFDQTQNIMTPIKGEYEILYGSSSQPKDLKSTTVTLN